MAYETRVLRNYKQGTLSEPVAVSALQIKSAQFTTLPTFLSMSVYIPIAIGDPSTGAYEIVYATGHAKDSDTVTVVRGREGTSAAAWNAATAWSISALERDYPVYVDNRAALADLNGHTGMRAVLADSGQIVEKTATQGWASQLAVNAADINAGGALAEKYTPFLKVARVAARTNAQAILTCTLPNGAYPNGILSAQGIIGSGQNGSSALLAGLTASQVQFLIRRADGSLCTSDDVILHCWALGY